MTGDGGEPTRRACLRAALSVGAAAGLAGCPTLGADDGEASSDTPAGTPSNPTTATETPTATASPTPTPTPTREPLVRLSGEFAAYRGDAHRRASVPDRTGPSDDPGIAYSRELPGPVVQPVGSGSQLLLAGRDWLAAFDPKRGVREWNLSLDAVVGKPPVVADGTAVLATDTGLIAVEADSTVAWRGTPTGVAAFAPTRVGDRFCVVGDRGLALYTDSGRERWSVPLGERALATPAATAETVYVPVRRGGDEPAVFALTASKGATDWRTTLLGLGVAGFGLAALAWVLARDSPSEAGLPEIDGVPLARTPSLRQVTKNAGSVLRERETWLVGTILFCGTGVNVTVFGLWGVPYLVQTYGLSVTRASTFTLLGSGGLFVGPPLVGWVSDRLGRRTGLLVVGQAVYALAFLVLAVTGDPPLAVVALVFFGAGFLAGAYALGYAVVKERHASGASGVATGTVNTLAFSGAALLPTLMGLVLDTYWTGETIGGARVYSVLGYRVAFGLAALAGVIAMVAAGWLHTRTR